MSTRTATPNPPEKTSDDGAKDTDTKAEGEAPPAKDGETDSTLPNPEATSAGPKSQATEELSPEVQSKLRRLQKLESKYHGRETTRDMHTMLD